MQQPTLECADFLSGLLLVPEGRLAGLLGLGGPLGGQAQLPGAVRWTRGLQRRQPVAFAAQLGGG